jgi:hypothetical protein
LIHNFQDTSELDVILKPEPGSSPKDVMLKFVIVRNGKVVSGECWKQALVSGQTHRQMRFKLKSGDKPVVLVVGVDSAIGEESLDAEKAHAAEMTAVVPQEISTQVMPVLVGSGKLIRVGFHQNAPFCSSCHTQAVNDCVSSGGIGSYSCTESTQACSYSCKIAENQP